MRMSRNIVANTLRYVLLISTALIKAIAKQYPISNARVHNFDRGHVKATQAQFEQTFGKRTPLCTHTNGDRRETDPHDGIALGGIAQQRASFFCSTLFPIPGPATTMARRKRNARLFHHQ